VPTHDFAPVSLRITSAREADAASTAFTRDGGFIRCGWCRFEAAAGAARSLLEIPVPSQFGSLTEAASDLIEGRWTPKVDHERPATAQELDDAIRWHMDNRPPQDVHDSWRTEGKSGGTAAWGVRSVRHVDFKYRKGWAIASTPDRTEYVSGYDIGMEHWKRSSVIVDQNRQFHLCDPDTGRGYLCESSRGGWFDRRTYARWHPQPPTLLVGSLAGTLLSPGSGFAIRSADSYLVPDGAKKIWHEPSPR
jgi:hypothetical protein